MKNRFLIVIALALLAIALGCANQSASSYPPNGSYPPSGSYPQDATVASSGTPGVIPAGTELAIRTNEKIDARDASSASRDYDAEVARDIVDGRGQVLVPRGSNARLSVFQSNDKQMVLGVRSITVNGRSYSVQSGDITRGGGGLGANRETAKNVGGGALLGTLIGAVAGGGKGAAIGAAVGAAGGAAVQVLTKGRQVNVPAETILTFRLDEPLSLYGYSASNGY